MKYIDFGLMKTKENIIHFSKMNINGSGIFHWSYPFDCGFMNKYNFNKYKGSNNQDLFKTELSELIITNSKVNTLNLPISRPNSFKILFTYLNPDYTIPNASTQYGYINSYFDGFNKLISEKSYDEILDHTINSIDVFGLGFTLQFMANCFKRRSALSLEDFTRLSTFFHKMYDFNPSTRIIDIDDLLNEYENILLEIGVLTRLNISFINHNIVNKKPAPVVIMKKAIMEEKSAPQHLSFELQSIANEDPKPTQQNCSEGKELNPTTKRCVTKCKPGFSRNDKFQCRKNTRKMYATNKIKTNRRRFSMVSVNELNLYNQSKHINSPIQKTCLEGKELNPKTKRCVKKCKPGFSRNTKFECRKKTNKIHS
jgi:hypothetical protein